MKTIYTQECKETPEGATHYRNVGLATFFYKSDEYPVLKWVKGEWVECTDPNLKIMSLNVVVKSTTTKKLFKFSGTPESQPRYHITAMERGSRRIVIPAYKDDDGRTVWITPDHEVIRNEFIAERIANRIVELSKASYDKLMGSKPKAKKRPAVTVTRTILTGNYYRTLQAG